MGLGFVGPYIIELSNIVVTEKPFHLLDWGQASDTGMLRVQGFGVWGF